MPFTSPFGNFDVPETNLWSFLFDRKDRSFPDDQIVLQDGDNEARNYTFGQLRELSELFGKGLHANYKLRKGQTVAVFAPNDIDYTPVVLGAMWAGAIVTTINPGYTLPEIIHQLRDSKARIIMTTQCHVKAAREACHALGIQESHIVLMGAKKDFTRTYKHWQGVCHLKCVTQSQEQVTIEHKEDTAFLVYSSGTTGVPKGVRLTHYNMISNILQIKSTELAPLNWKGSANKVKGIPDAPAQGDTILTFLPFFHIYGLTHTALAPVYTGVKTVVMSQFGIEKWCSLAQQYKCTVAYIVPPIAVLLSKHAAATKYDLSSFRMMVSGAAPLSKDLVETVFSRTGIRIKQGYGLSEASPTAFAQTWEDWKNGVGSTGKLLPNMEAKFCFVPGSDGYCEGTPKEVPAGRQGELYLRGPNIFTGYHNNETATRECLDKDGWFRTGDVGFLDKDSNLFITDRVKELIQYKGYHIAPAEIEGYLMNHPIVEDAAVIGVHNEEHNTEVPTAYLVRKGGMSAIETGDDWKIVEWLGERVDNHKKLRGGVTFVESIPKNPSGKILRSKLKDGYAGEGTTALSKPLEDNLCTLPQASGAVCVGRMMW